MNTVTTLFLSTFTTLLAIINPLEVLPVFLTLLEGQDQSALRRVARRACIYATLLLFFFLIFGTLLLKVFDVPLSMVRIVGGIILTRIGFALFLPSRDTASILPNAPAGRSDSVAFVPLAMPLMFGPGAIATVLGMTSFVRHPFTEFPSLVAIIAAIILTMITTYLILAYADLIVGHIGPAGIDAATRIVGFFVSAIGVGLIFHGVMEAIQIYWPAKIA
ncbi:MAG TPA: MarC family protein [Candidatus Udaeobacter sp.]|nr:MarC family protein [Candidatus Udaeobacter sp.]